MIFRKKKYEIRTFDEHSIEPEEVFLDELSENYEEGRKIELPIHNRNFVFLFAISVIVLTAIFSKTMYLQVFKHGYYGNAANANRIRVYPERSQRGIIYDNFGKQLVYNIPTFDLVVVPVDLHKNNEEFNKTVKELANILKIEEGNLRKKIDSQGIYYTQKILIAENIKKEKALLIEERFNNMPGVSIERNSIRDYVDGKYFAHVIGYVGKINYKELKEHPDYYLADYIGKIGVEESYEKYLRGEYGREEKEVDSHGIYKRTISYKKPSPGSGIMLSIDGLLQKKAYDELKGMLDKLKLNKGAVVAMDPRDGRILALVSIPSFDNNFFSGKVKDEDFAEVLKNTSEPLFNRAISGQYPPGSTVKPLMAIAALEENVIDPKKTIYVTGSISVPNIYNPNIIYYFKDWRAHGIVDMVRAIGVSSNVYFYTIGGGYKDIKGLGIERIKKYMKKFGFGASSGIDIKGEAKGLVPDKQWKKEVKNENWYIGDTYHISIGQGDLSITPLQLTNYISAIGNGGILYQPQVVDKILNSDMQVSEDIKPIEIRRNLFSAENMKVVIKGMRESVLFNSAGISSFFSKKVAGKTGTAQFGEADKTHAWFSGFGPYDDPKIVITVLIEGTKSGSTAAVPVARSIFDWYANNRL